LSKCPHFQNLLAPDERFPTLSGIRTELGRPVSTQQNLDVDLESKGKQLKRVYRRRILLPLELSDIVPVKPSQIGDLFLREAGSLPKKPQIASDH
jgi:hypothetical protein